MKTAVRQMALLALLLFVTALLTTLFSILGALSVSVVAGMASGAGRRWKWKFIPTSLIFPLVGLTLTQAAKADLAIQQRVLTAALCFGAFWATYCLTWALFCLEKKSEGPSKEFRQLNSAPGVERIPSFGLDDLQGTWQLVGADGKRQTMQIAANKFALRRKSDGGNSEPLVQGEIQLNGSDASPVIHLSTNTAIVRDANSKRDISTA
jgi:hypothetical protein